jgi:hypothetical protein
MGKAVAVPAGPSPGTTPERSAEPAAG